MASEASTPFEWLFGKSKGGIESIDSSKDVAALLTGVEKDLSSILTEADKGENENDPLKFLEARLSRLRFLLYDERNMTSQLASRRSAPAVASTLSQTLTGEKLYELMPRLIENLSSLPFECRKHAVAVFNYLLVCGLDGSDADLYKSTMEEFRHYVETNYLRLMKVIVEGHAAVADVAILSGSMYRSCMRHPSLYRQLVGTTERATKFVFPFLDVYVVLPNFDVSSDAMESIRVLFTANTDRIVDEQTRQVMAEIGAEFLNRDYEQIWDKRFNPKLLSDESNYMIRRVALQILSTVLLTRSNYAVMIKYVASRDNLILVMKLLRDTSPHITLDAFHVFKVFVANPNKPPEVIKILQDNKVKLCRYLATLHQDKEASDTQFREEKSLIIATIEGI
jgi:calcium binding protein 39